MLEFRTPVEMPTEIISLLSSSPTGPPPTAVASSSRLSKLNNLNGPCRVLDYEAPDLTIAERRRNVNKLASHIPIEPLVGTKRTSSHPTHHDSNDFLFLSDDFDTTGEIGSSITKKPRTSPNPSQHGKKADSVRLKKTKSAVDRSLCRNPLQPINNHRWSFLAEDIEFSSPPANSTTLEAVKGTPETLSDPFASPQKEPVPKSTSVKANPENPFASSPRKSNKMKSQATWNWPPGLPTSPQELPQGNHGAQRSSKTRVINLSSDPLSPSPRRKSQPKPSNTGQVAAWDPISSSAPESREVQDLLSSPPVSLAARPSAHSKATVWADCSESDDLPNLDDVDFSRLRTLDRSHSLSTHSKSRPSKQLAKKLPKSTEEKEREKKQKAETRGAEMERKRVEKERAKEERALQKEKERALAEVNKLRTDKKVSTPEMIVDIPFSINPGLKVQIETLLSDLDVQYETWNSTVENAVKWRRKVTSRFNEEMGFWEPTPMRIKEEDHILVIVQAAELVKFVLGEEGHDLEAHVLHMKSKFPNYKLMYLIEGLATWMRKNRNLLNRQFASAVRNLGTSAESGPSSSQSRRRTNNQHREYIDEDKIEDALLSLQVMHGTLVHHTSAPVETAQWVAIFTQHISTIPYRKARDTTADAGFCMEAGQVRTGDGAKDTYIRMLQEIARVTTPVAYGIAAKYESLKDLVRGLEAEGPLALEDCRKSANKDGALTDRTIGQAISKRVHKIFLGRDPISTDI
ncbi:hypothetical protein F5Y19DRAFT_207987 [Xylariaceae sp. FL1651]|nr:hypothetical protein F5Y19DRAFT_207987 [Xylariaceae sp. FL1651]